MNSNHSLSKRINTSLVLSLLTLTLLLTTSCSNKKTTKTASDKETPKISTPVAKTTITPAKFPGGEIALQKHLQEYIWDHLITDKYISEMTSKEVEFVIDATGKVSNPRIIAENFSGYKKETLAAVSSLAQWNPATKDGTAIASKDTCTVCFCWDVIAQKNEERKRELEMDNQVYSIVEKDPVFDQGGGPASYAKYMKSHLQYPSVCKRMGIEGNVYIGCIVDKLGNTTDVQVLRGLHENMDKEAVRFVRSFPKWAPGKTRGKIVNCRQTIVVRFRMR